MSGSRPTFSLPLYGALQVLIVLGYTLRPSWYRPLMFIPILATSCYLVFYTTAGAVADVGLGGGIAAQVLYAFDGIVLNNVQNILFRNGEKPGQIMSSPFLERLAWSWHLHNSPRGVGWNHEVSHIPKNHPSLNAPGGRKMFILTRFLTLCWCAGVQAVFMIINAANPALVPGASPLINRSLYIRALSVLGLGIPAFTQINSLHCVASILLVASGISEPADWPPLFGSFTQLYTVQNFWKNFWHQMLRRPLLTIANFLLHDILHLPRHSPRFSLPIRFLKIHTAFFVSALVHLCGEYMMLGRLGYGAFWFFVLQPWAIIFEISVLYLITGSTHPPSYGKLPNMMSRFLGYVWVLLWFISVGHFLQQPMIEVGLFVGFPDSEITRTVGRWLALDVI